MNSLKSSLAVLGSAGLLFLGACGSGNQVSNSSSSPAASPSAAVPKTEPSSASASPSTTAKTEHGESKKGGQVVETGKYHLEFVPEKEDKGTHMDFYLQKGDDRETVPTAKVSAQVQLPDGTQKQVPLTYDAEGKHYTALLPEKASGQYQLKVSADINGEKVDGRFNFSK